MIVCKEGVGFRDAHGLVSEAVKRLAGDYSPDAMVNAVVELSPSLLGCPLTIEKAPLLLALDARSFVERRTIPGGPAREPIENAIRLSEENNRAVEAWMEEKTTLLASYREKIGETAAGLIL